MSGHSRWSTIKHRKAISDAKKSKGWTKLIKEIMVSARAGSDFTSNFRLRTAVDRAKAANIPADTIDRAIKKGAKELENDQVEELTYQIYGPLGVAFIVELATDNRNRTASEIRKILDKNNARIDASGSVLHKFKKRGLFWIEKSLVSEEELTQAALELGALDIVTEEDVYLVLCEPSDFPAIKEGFSHRQFSLAESNVGMHADSIVEVSSSEALSLNRLLEQLEDHEDVLRVYTNFVAPKDDV